MALMVMPNMVAMAAWISVHNVCLFELQSGLVSCFLNPPANV
jgi:hypothetical protein